MPSSFPQITMGYSVRIILAQCETMYELSIRCVNCTQHTFLHTVEMQLRWSDRNSEEERFLFRIAGISAASTPGALGMLEVTDTSCAVCLTPLRVGLSQWNAKGCF